MSELRRATLPAALLTVALGLAFIFQPVPFGLAFRAWLVGVGALVAGAVIRASLAPFPRVAIARIRFRSRRPPARERPAGLEEVERAVDFSGWNPADLRRRLRPLLREVAAHRLLARRGIDLEREPAQARRLLGESAWLLLEGGSAEMLAGAAMIGDAVDHLEAL